jgi:trk system potassium uptake protein TrkA
MKSVLIIGMGKFGHHLCENMAKLGNELMIVDEQEEAVEDLASVATSVRIGDCTNEEVLRSLGVGNFDLCIVCIGSNFQSSLEITSLLKDLGAKYVISKANRDIHAKFLLRNGADEVIYPNRDIAKRLAMRLSANHVFDYIQLTEEYAIYEIPVMRAWIGESIRSINFRAKYKVNILGIKSTEETNFMPDADYRFEGQEHLMVLGLKEDVNRILKAL